MSRATWENQVTEWERRSRKIPLGWSHDSIIGMRVNSWLYIDICKVRWIVHLKMNQSYGQSASPLRLCRLEEMIWIYQEKWGFVNSVLSRCEHATIKSLFAVDFCRADHHGIKYNYRRQDQKVWCQPDKPVEPSSSGSRLWLLVTLYIVFHDFYCAYCFKKAHFARQ